METEPPPFSDQEYAELARRYRLTGGREPDAAERAVIARLGLLATFPRREIRLSEIHD